MTKYKSTDAVDEWLLNQVVKHINYDELDLLAVDLRVPESSYCNISSTKKKGLEVLKLWAKSQTHLTVEKLIDELKDWIQDGYVDTSVWRRLQNCVFTDVLPTFSERSELRQRSLSSESLASSPPVTSMVAQSVSGTPPITPTTSSSTDLSKAVSSLKIQTDELDDCHILELSKRITSETELNDLGIKGLKLPDYIVKAALYNKGIQDAACNVLSEWSKQQGSKTEAYQQMLQCLQRCQMNQLATELKQWVQGVVDEPYQVFNSLQENLKWSLKRRWAECLTHDWLPEDKTWGFRLMHYYTDLRWTRKVKHALKQEKKALRSMFEVLEVDGAGPKRMNILVEAKPGMGKTSSMAMLAMECSEDEKNAFPFEFVFLIPLRNVNKEVSLPELIVAEHDLEGTDTNIDTIRSILNGQTNHKVLLLLDGYDEYTPGTNTAIDNVINHGIGNCFTIITSRPERHSEEQKTPFVTQNIRNKMDAELIVEGFSEENIRKCSTKYLDREDRSEEMLKMVKESNIYGLLSVPIILLMVCVLYNDQGKLPKSRTEVFQHIYKHIMNRSVLKYFGCKAEELENFNNMLRTLGKFAWEALQDDVRQLLLRKEKLIKACLLIMKLGLVHEVATLKATLEEVPIYVSFEHKSFQELASALYITQELEEVENFKVTLNKFFPTWYHIMRFEEVVVFTAGLMKDPTPLIRHISKEFTKMNTVYLGLHNRFPDEEKVRDLKRFGKTAVNLDFFHLVCAESRIPLPRSPLQNPHFNWFDHERDDQHGRARDRSCVYIPSGYYSFQNLKEPVSFHNTEKLGKIVPCSMIVDNPQPPVVDSLLSTCSVICKHQPVINFSLFNLKIKSKLTADVFKLSHNAQFLEIEDCVLPSSMMSSLLDQTSACPKLNGIRLKDSTFEEPGNLGSCLSEIIQKSGDDTNLEHLVVVNCSLISDQCIPVLKSLSRCKQLTYLNLSENMVGNAGRHLVKSIRKWGPNPPLKYLYLNNCRLHEDDCAELFQSLLGCCNLESVSLGGNTIGKAAGHLGKVFEKLGGRLKKLNLPNCSLPEDQFAAMMESLSLCKQLTCLNLSDNRTGNAGKHLADSIKEWGVNPPLKELDVENCGLHEDDCAELFQSLLGCCNLEVVSLGENTIGKASGHLVKVIEKLGGKIKTLYLPDCSIPQDQWVAILESLSLCKQLTCLNLSDNRIGNAGKHLADSIKEWGVNPPLKELDVENCGLHEDDCAELFQSLLGCCNLKVVILSGNTIGKASTHLVKIINNCGQNQCLQQLYVRKCWIPGPFWHEIMKSLAMCKTLTWNDLRYNTIGENVLQLAESIGQWGDNPPLRGLLLYGCLIPEKAGCEVISALFNCKHLTHLSLTGSHLCENGLHLKRYLEMITDTLQSLCLDGCCIPIDVSSEIVSVLTTCRNLFHMSLPGNTLTGTLSQFVPHRPLAHLDLSDTELNKDDVDHLADIIQRKKVPNLRELFLDGNSLESNYKETETLLDTCIKHHPSELTVFLFRNDLTKEFEKEWTSRCEGTKVKLNFDTYS